MQLRSTKTNFMRREAIIGSGVPNCARARLARRRSFHRSFRFDDPDDNHLELCVRRKALGDGRREPRVFECVDWARAQPFYTEALGLKPAGEMAKSFFEFANGQMIGVKQVKSFRSGPNAKAGHVTSLLTSASKTTTPCWS